MKKRLFIPLAIILTLLIGVFAVVAVAANSDPTLKVTGANLEFSDRVHMLFAVDSDNISDTENIQLLVFRGSVTADTMVKGKEITALSPGEGVNEGTVTGNVYTYTDIAAAEMTEYVYVRAYYKDEEGTAFYSKPIKYSILQYAYNKLGYTATASTNEKLIKMLNGMLIYGGAAQEYFEYNLDRLATAAYVKLSLVGATFDDGFSSGLFVKGTSVTVHAPTTDELPYVLFSDENGKLVPYKDNCVIKAEKNMTYTANLKAYEPSFGAYDRVIILGVDGAGSFYPDNVNAESTRIQEKIFATGSVTRTMRVGTPTASCVGWNALLHGSTPENLGYVENIVVETAETYPHDSKYPSILKLVKDADPTSEVAALYNWIGIHGSVEQNYGITTKNITNDADLTDYIVNSYLPNNDPRMLFVHLGNPDYVGHTVGHHTDAYYESINTAYTQIEDIYDALAANGLLEDTLLIVTTDHGGINLGHGGLTDYEKYGMFAVAGKTVVNGGAAENMQIRDAATVALYALGLEQPDTYTSCMPAGIFNGVEATERTEYHDVDNPRYHLPEATPEAGSDSYVTNFITDKDLLKYLPFDGDTTDVTGNSTATEHGTILYKDGYFGKGIFLDDGHIDVSNFAPGTDSFTIAMWMKCPSPHVSSPVIANKAADTSAQGFMLAFERTGHDYLKARFNFGNGVVSATNDIDLPEDYFSGWMHVIMIFDRENEEMRLCFDFGEIYSNAIHSYYATMEGTSMTTVYDYLTLGNDTTGEATYKCGLSVDEFMLFDGAFTKDDVASLAEYFGKTVEEDDTLTGVAGEFDKDGAPDVYFDFEGDAEFEGSSPAFSLEHTTTATGKLTYADGKVGQAVYLPGTEYITLSGLDIGTSDLSFAFWINPTDLSFGGGNRYKLPIFSTTENMSRGKQGMALTFDVEYGNLTLFMSDGQGTNNVQNLDFKMAQADYENKWTHFVVTIDRANQRFIVYVDFEKVIDVSLTLYGSSALLPSDVSVNSDYKFTIGQYGSVLSTQYLKAYMDDLMIFKRTLIGDDIITMAKYYGYQAKLSDYVSHAPVIDMGFNGSASEGGSYGGTVTDAGVNYVDGYFNEGATFSKGGVALDNLELNGKEYTISFWINTDSFGYNFAYDNYWYRNIFATQTGNTTESQGFAIVAKGDYGSRGGIFVNFSNGSSATRSYVGAEYPADMEANQWVHVTVVIDQDNSDGSTSVKIYYNFKEATLLTNYLVSNFPSTDLNGAEGTTPHIGTDGTGTYDYTYTEKLDEFLLFDKALTAEEIAKLGEYYAALTSADNAE